MNYDPDDDPWAAAPKADPPVLQIFGDVQQGTPPINLPPAATAMPKSGFPEHSAAAMGTESVFPPAKASAPASENLAAKQLPILKPSGPNKAARNSTPKIEEVPEEVDGDGTGGRMDESFKRNRDVFEDDDELFGFEYIPADVSPPWFPNHLWGIPTTIQHNATRPSTTMMRPGNMQSGFWHTIRPRSQLRPSRRLQILPLSSRR